MDIGVFCCTVRTKCCPTEERRKCLKRYLGLVANRHPDAPSTFPVDFDPYWVGCKAIVKNVNNSEMKVDLKFLRLWMANDLKTYQSLLLQQGMLADETKHYSKNLETKRKKYDEIMETFCCACFVVKGRCQHFKYRGKTSATCQVGGLVQWR